MLTFKFNKAAFNLSGCAGFFAVYRNKEMIIKYTAFYDATKVVNYNYA